MRRKNQTRDVISYVLIKEAKLLREFKAQRYMDP
jgi:hypothetical protein